jgi:hypothetical protein
MRSGTLGKVGRHRAPAACHLVRYAGCLAPHSTLRDAIIPTLCQQGANHEETKTGTPYWHWAQLLGRVCDLDMATCLPPLCGRREPCDLPFCRLGSFRMGVVLKLTPPQFAPRRPSSRESVPVCRARCQAVNLVSI